MIGYTSRRRTFIPSGWKRWQRKNWKDQKRNNSLLLVVCNSVKLVMIHGLRCLLFVPLECETSAGINQLMCEFDSTFLQLCYGPASQSRILPRNGSWLCRPNLSSSMVWSGAHCRPQTYLPIEGNLEHNRSCTSGQKQWQSSLPLVTFFHLGLTWNFSHSSSHTGLEAPTLYRIGDSGLHPQKVLNFEVCFSLSTVLTTIVNVPVFKLPPGNAFSEVSTPETSSESHFP